MPQEPQVDPYAEIKAKLHKEYAERIKKQQEFMLRRKQPTQQIKEDAPVENTSAVPTTQDPNVNYAAKDLERRMHQKLFKGIHLRKKYHRKYRHNHHKDAVKE